MLKFLKSSAKGKEGCLVRPPEINTSSISKNFINIDIEDDENVFEEGSILSFTLQRILDTKELLNYFIQFMDEIEKVFIVECWVEVNNFSLMINENSKKICNNNNFETNIDDNSQISKEHRKAKHKTKCSDDDCETYFNNITHSDENKYDEIEYALNIFKKYIALESPFQLQIPSSIRKEVIKNICQPEGNLDKDCFKPFLNYLFQEIETNYLNYFLKSSYCIKAQIDILTENTPNLKDILYNETILFFFTEYMEQESSRHLLEFLMAVINFRKHATSNMAQNQIDAIVIYEKYLSLQAPASINVESEIRIRVENEICHEDGGPLPTCFDETFKIIFKRVNQHVDLFLKSDLHHRYLSEMVNSVNSSLNTNRPVSTCSSECSVSTHNTLLATVDPHFHKKKHKSVPDMTIDSNQIYNADSLWKRKRQDGLSIGRINSLGQFESKFEPDPDRKDQSVLKKMVNRLMPKTMIAEEEIAWQVAHMIVKDVTDLTMSQPENYSE